MSENITTNPAADPNYLTLNLIRKGYHGKDVKFAQEQLLMFMPDYAADVVADGIFGTVTESAMKAFQMENGLDADGICGAMTWNRLCPTVCADYVYWRKDKAIQRVQNILVEQGFLDAEYADGLFGWRTENAINAFQTAYSIPVDGRFGKQGWSIIQSLKAAEGENQNG